MIQEIVIDRPPNFDYIAEALPQVKVRKGIIYSYGPRIYNPDGHPIGDYLLAHESVHGERQGTNEQGILDWWDRYLTDLKFRLAEEVPAHQAEYRWWLEHGSRPARRRACRLIAQRLAGPLYGRLVTRRAAEDMLREALRA